MTASRKAKKYDRAHRHWHATHCGFGPVSEDICYRTHREKLVDSRRRRVETIMRRVKRKDRQVRRDVRKSRIPITQFLNIEIDASHIVSIMQKMKRASLSADAILMASVSSMRDYRASMDLPPLYEKPAPWLEFAEEMEKGMELTREKARYYWNKANPSMGNGS